MGWKIKGTLHKRRSVDGKDVYIPASDPAPGTWYVRYQQGGKSRNPCLDTGDADIARERWAEMLASMETSRQRASEDEAAREKRHLMKKIREGEQATALYHKIEGPGSALKVDGAWDAFLASHLRPVGTSERTLTGYRQQFNRFSLWAGPRLMRDIIPAHCSAYIKDMEEKGLLPVTVNKHLGLLELVWRCVDPDWKNPWSNLHSTKEHIGGHFRSFTHAECKRIYKQGDDEFKLLLLLGYNTGARSGDLSTLKWEMVNMRDRTLTIPPGKTFRRTGKAVVIPLTDQLYEALSPLPRDIYVMPSIALMYKTNPSGIPKRITATIKKAKVFDSTAGKASFHSFRHTFESMLTNAGAPLEVAARMMGQSLPGMAERYVHMDTKVLREWVLKAVKPL
jgi:integrase